MVCRLARHRRIAAAACGVDGRVDRRKRHGESTEDDAGATRHGCWRLQYKADELERVWSEEI